ncbi:MAG TPA: Ig-like domain-containing protein [Gammaproteobacteria bacterium]
MKSQMLSKFAALILLASLAACGGGGSGLLTDQGVTSSLPGSSGPASNQVPTLTYTGFAVVHDNTETGYSAKVVVFFSEDMDPASLNTRTFIVRGPDSKPVAGAIDYLGVTAVFTPTGSFTADTSYTAEITTGARSAAGVAMAKDRSWKFRTPSAAELTGVLVKVASTSPSDLEMDVPLNTGVNVTFNRVMDPATINRSTFVVADPDGTPVAGDVHYTGVTATFVPSVPFAPNTSYRVYVSDGAKSLSGVPMDEHYHGVFTTGTTLGAAAPQVVLNSPMDQDTGVSLGTAIAVYFDQAMDTRSINSANIAVFAPTGEQLDGTVTYAGTTAVFTPATALLPQSVYTVRVAAAVSSAGGAQMGSDYFFSFTTGSFSLGASLAPTVMFSDPAPYATGVAPNTKISIAFSEEMDPTTLTTDTIRVTDQDGNAVAGTVSYQGSAAFFVPASRLQGGITYTVTVSGRVQSLVGTAMGADLSWTFTTTMPM